MRVVFITHNDLGRACIEELHDGGADVAGMFTRPPEPDVADQTEFADLADRVDAGLHHVESVNDDRVVDKIASYDPELLFVVGWSRLVERRVIDLSSVASLGMHPAPLPRGRGRAPIAWSIIKGLEETALSMFHLVEAPDAGDLVGQRPISIDIQDDAASLYAKVVDAGRKLIQEYYPRLEAGEVPRVPQDDEKATWWPKRRPHHGAIDWNASAKEVYDWIRGQTRPYPGAFSYLDERKVRIWEADPPNGERVCAKPGEILDTDGDRLRVAMWEESLYLTKVQVEENDEIMAADLVNEYDFTIGDTFENVRDHNVE